MSNLKPFLVGGIIVAADKMILNQQDMNSSLYFGVAGVAQVYLERKMKLDFMDVQNEIAIHFVVLLLCATLFTTGITLFIIEFIKYGKPTDEALIKVE